MGVIDSDGNRDCPQNLQNYVADWTMSFTWGLIVGTASPIPYFYSIFFITVLVHRTTRDFERCVAPACPHTLVDNDSLKSAFFLGVPSSTAKNGHGIARL
jgi:hypothetical protein